MKNEGSKIFESSAELLIADATDTCDEDPADVENQREEPVQLEDEVRQDLETIRLIIHRKPRLLPQTQRPRRRSASTRRFESNHAVDLLRTGSSKIGSN